MSGTPNVTNTKSKVLDKSKTAAQIIAQKNVGEAAITVVRETLRNRLPDNVRAFLDNPIADVVIALVIVGLQEHYVQNSRFGYIANGALLAGMDTAVDGLGIQEIVSDLMKQLSGQIPLEVEVKE